MLLLASLVPTLSGCRANDTAGELRGAGLSGSVLFQAYSLPEFELTSLGARSSFEVGLSTREPWVDGACRSYWSDVNQDMRADRQPEAPPGRVEFYVDEALVDIGRPEWTAGDILGARASGDVFPAFDVPDALTAPSGMDDALPAAIDFEADLSLTWEGPFADGVAISVVKSFTDTADVLSCTFDDDGAATISAADLSSVAPDGNLAEVSLRLGRLAELATTVDGADLTFTASATSERAYSR